MKVLVTYATYHCDHCNGMIRFEHLGEYGATMHPDRYAIGECVDNRCPSFGKKLKITPHKIDVEPIA